MILLVISNFVTLVEGPDVPRAILEKRLAQAAEENSQEEGIIRDQLNSLLLNRKKLTTDVIKIINEVTGNDEETKKVLASKIELTPKSMPCHKDVVEQFHEKCYNLGCNGYAMKEINHFATLCEFDYDTEVIKTAIASTCTFENVCGVE